MLVFTARQRHWSLFSRYWRYTNKIIIIIIIIINLVEALMNILARARSTWIPWRFNMQRTYNVSRSSAVPFVDFTWMRCRTVGQLKRFRQNSNVFFRSSSQKIEVKELLQENKLLLRRSWSYIRRCLEWPCCVLSMAIQTWKFRRCGCSQQGGAENAGRENDGREIDGPMCRAWNCRGWNCMT